MPKPRTIAAALGAALFAAGLSFGASLATGEPRADGNHFTPVGVCVLAAAPAASEN